MSVKISYVSCADVYQQEWAIFYILHGKKLYLTSLNSNDTFGVWDKLKYNDELVLKFTLTRVKELVDKNQGWYDKFGVVNNKGLQLRKGKFDNLWKKQRENM